MGFWYDFVIKYDPAIDTPETLTRKVFHSIIIRRLKAKKPAVMFLSGKSGEGKSQTAVKVQQVLLDILGFDVRDYLNAINVYTPLEYPTKLDALLYNKELKKIPIICMHEAREIVRSTHWQNFLTTSIADVNALSRAIKRMCIMIISQNLKDIAKEIRLTINYYCNISRSIGGNRNVRMTIYTIWEDDRDLDNPRLRKRRLTGYLVYPDGKYKKWTPQYLEVRKLDKDIADMLDKADKDAKTGILKGKLNKLMKEMKKDLGSDTNKIDAMVDYYIDNNENLNNIGKVKRGKLTITKDFKDMHSMTDYEVKAFQDKLLVRMEEKGIKPKDENTEL